MTSASKQTGQPSLPPSPKKDRRTSSHRSDASSGTGSGKQAEGQEEATFSHAAYRRLEEMIVTLQLPPGTIVSEQSLAKKLDLGRTPIREALQRLARDGLVVVLQRRGVLVSDINLRTQLRLLEVRRELERLMARLACERATDGEAARFAAIAREMLAAANSNDDLAFMRLDLEFNTLVAEAAHNEFAQRSIGSMNGLSRRFWYQHYKKVADLPLTAKLHAAVADAIGRRAKEEAGAASDALVDYIESFARKTLDH